MSPVTLAKAVRDHCGASLWSRLKHSGTCMRLQGAGGVSSDNVSNRGLEGGL